MNYFIILISIIFVNCENGFTIIILTKNIKLI